MADKIRTVTLENLEPRMVCYNLDHNHALPRLFPRVAKLANGQEHGHTVEVRLPDSVTFLAREVKTMLPASILECDEIASALAPRGHGERPRLRQRGDVIESDAAEEAADVSTTANSADADAPREVVNTPARKAREAARSVLGTGGAVVEKGQG